MSRLIIVPQYPANLRYQEWWWDSFVVEFKKHYDKIIFINGFLSKDIEKWRSDRGFFAPIDDSVALELKQIEEYMRIVLEPDDTLLVNDISFPGLFSNVLFHKRPKKCFAICHATSKNNYDYFAKDRQAKFPTETGVSRLFDKVFVGSNYHKRKLGWKNTVTIGLPYPPYKGYTAEKDIFISVASRKSPQKRTKHVEEAVEDHFNTKINEIDVTTWAGYQKQLARSKYLLITSKEETFGYQVMDAILHDCIPVAPFNFSYPELLSCEYLYKNIPQLIDILESELPVPILGTHFESKHFYNLLAETMKK